MTQAALRLDKYQLYVDAFQDPEGEVEFLTEVYTDRNGIGPRMIREDFCGTAAISVAWVCTAPDHYSTAVDIDPEPLVWCEQQLLQELSPDERRRLTLECGDCRSVDSQPVDVLLAPNCSFCVFKLRAHLLDYFHRSRMRLRDDGLMIMDIYAGPEAQDTGRDVINCSGYRAIWEQAYFDSATYHAVNRIHFEMDDGTKVRDAFVYDYRLWTPAELVDALVESGFRDAKVYREGVGEDGRGDGKFQPRSGLEPRNAWEAYIVGFC